LTHAALEALAGRKYGPSAWREVGQAEIDAFAGLSGDRQWIHVDAERARRETPWGGTIAHGNLTLALIDGFRDELLPPLPGAAMGVNYGYERVRFPSPVPAGSRVRGRVEIVSAEPPGDGGWGRLVQRFTVEREGSDKPVCVADSVVLISFG
jgi:acyl dehydratase